MGCRGGALDFREPIAPFVAGQPFHQSLEQMRACHILLGVVLPEPLAVM
jgi:hypothetical protein